MNRIEISRIKFRSAGAALLLTLALSAAPLVSYAGISQKLIVGNQSRTIKRALAEGKSVLIAEKTIFSPHTDFGESPSPMGGGYRPPLTYWLHRGTQETLVLGGYATEEGRGKLLTEEHHFFIIEPGIYDLVGFVRKTRRMSDLINQPKAPTPIRSTLGFVNYSLTTLPALYSYTAWVSPSYTGTTFDGSMMTNWYSPGYYEDRVGETATDAILVDMRGIAPYAQNGKSNLASFFVEPGQIAVIGDFKLEFTHGDCDKPAKGQWICAIESLTFATALTPQERDVQKAMTQLGYKSPLIEKINTALLINGEFFAGQKMKLAPDMRTTSGEPYAQFRVTSKLMERKRK
jgi:hypothetical protein